MEQISFQLPNTPLLVTILHKKRCYGRTEYNQSWFENIWVQRYEVLIYEIWQKEFKMGPKNFRIFAEHDSLKHRRKWSFSTGISFSNSLICFSFESVLV